jgi:hypothetical protein
MFMPFGFLARNDFYIICLSNLSFLIVPDEGLFPQKHAVPTKFDTYVFVWYSFIESYMCVL